MLLHNARSAGAACRQPAATFCRAVPRVRSTHGGNQQRGSLPLAGTAGSKSSVTPRRLVLARAQPLKVTQEELEAKIAERTQPIVVDFFATWCGPCLLLAQELEKVAKDLGDKVQVLKVDVDENPALSTQLQIQGLPTMIFIGMDQQKPALRTEGLLPAATIKNIILTEL